MNAFNYTSIIVYLHRYGNAIVLRHDVKIVAQAKAFDNAKFSS